MELPDLTIFCVPTAVAPQDMCIRMPGGGMLCAQVDIRTGDVAAITEAFLAQLNAALTPLQPLFNIIDLLKLVIDCISAIPDCLGPPPDPTGLLNCIPGLVAALNKLLQMIPQMSIPIMVSDIINLLIYLLLGLRQDLGAILRQLERIAAAATRAATTGNLQLQVVLDCATGNADAQLENLNASLAPLNRLLGLINTFLKLLDLPCLPTLANLGASDAALGVIDDIIAVLQRIKALFPFLALPAIPTTGADGKCD